METIVTPNCELVNFTLADGVYDYDDPVDKFVVIIGGEEVAWAETKPQAERSFNELLHYDNEHFKHCPDDYDWKRGHTASADEDLGLESPL